LLCGITTQESAALRSVIMGRRYDWHRPGFAEQK
jgi:hypothetical protein